MRGRDRFAWGRVAALGLLLSCAALVRPSTAHGDTSDPRDEVPTGAVAFFGGGACPPGWAPAEDLEGRAVIGVTASPHVGVTVGKPLADREDRAHEHAFKGAVTLATRGSLVLDGGNRDGAAAKAYTVSGVTSATTSGMAFVQVQACAKL
jgi:hypothetical protein